MRYELCYRPPIQERGMFIRLALEEGCADDVDVAREERLGSSAVNGFFTWSWTSSFP